jgi:hypothetical protein
MLSSWVRGLEEDKMAGSPTMRIMKRRKCVAAERADGRTVRSSTQFEGRGGVKSGDGKLESVTDAKAPCTTPFGTDHAIRLLQIRKGYMHLRFLHSV